MKLRKQNLAVGIGIGAVALALSWSPFALADEGNQRGKWLAGDFHNHTFLTDGSNTQSEVLDNAFRFGLDWLANSEHGGAFNRTPQGLPWPTDTVFLGTPPSGKMWRWQSLWQYSYPLISEARTAHPDKLIVQGYEWNVPSHEHASVGIVGPAEESGLAIARHEYLFDGSDSGSTSDSHLGVSGKILTNNHDKAVAGAKWLQDNYPFTSYFLINHPSRALKYSIADIRDFNNAAPTVAFGFEGIPGHQKESNRGGYGNASDKARTYGGADYMIAKIGGLWDALLGEGRNFFSFVNSDFHSTKGDFWPGEYAKSYAFVIDKNRDKNISLDELVDGLRSGNSFSVHGDLISNLHFSAHSRDDEAPMGGVLHVDKGSKVKLKIRFRTPERNNNGDTVAVDHIDLIAGNVTGKIPKYLDDGVTLNPEYAKDTNESSRIIATFSRNDWDSEKDGYSTIVYQLKNVKSDMYFRLRGTNLPAGTANETDAEGNPLIDTLMGPNTPEKAYADLWFYSNPIFVKVAHCNRK